MRGWRWFMHGWYKMVLELLCAQLVGDGLCMAGRGLGFCARNKYKYVKRRDTNAEAGHIL